MINTYLVDSFTDEPFKGNPAGVCLLTNPLSEEQMQLIAMELGLSETAFVSTKSASPTYNIRYFSPKMEIPLCGHATLAASKVLFEIYPASTSLHLVNIQHLDLMISKEGDQITMAFPVYDTSPATAPQKLLTALGLDEILNCAYNAETNILLLEIISSDVLQNLQPNYSALVDSHDDINGVLVTARSIRAGYDFESRYFWPWSGTNEDPVTGGTHTFLAKYWSERLAKKKMNSYQCSARTGFMEVALTEDNKLLLTSTARIILQGQLNIFK